MRTYRAAIVALRTLSPPPPRPRVVAARLAAAAALLALAATGARLAPPVLAGLLAAVLVALIAFEGAFATVPDEPAGDANDGARRLDDR